MRSSVPLSSLVEVCDQWAAKSACNLLAAAAEAASGHDGELPPHEPQAFSIDLLRPEAETFAQVAANVGDSLYRTARQMGRYVGRQFAGGGMRYLGAHITDHDTVEIRFCWTRYGTVAALSLVSPDCYRLRVGEAGAQAED